MFSIRNLKVTVSVYVLWTNTLMCYNLISYSNPPQYIAICPRTFSNHVWWSLLMACRRYIQWYISYFKFNHKWLMFVSWYMRFLYHTQRQTTVSRIPLDEWSACSQRPLPDNTQHSKQTNIHAAGGIQTLDLRRRATTDLRLRPRGHWDRHSNVRVNICQIKSSRTMCVLSTCNGRNSGSRALHGPLI